MNRKLLLAALFIGSTLVWQSCGNKSAGQGAAQQAPAERVVQVTFGQVTEEVVTGVQSYPATAVPLNEAELRAEVSGYITAIYVTDGALVTKGQKLYEIDRTRYIAAVNQAKAALEIAKSNYDKVSRDLVRYRNLAAKDAIAKQTLDYAITDLSNQEAQVASAKAALVTAQTDLNRSTIIAPFTGAVGISQVRQGALVSAGTTILNTLSSTNPVAVEFQVAERDLNQFIALQKGGKTSAISVVLPDGQTYEAAGTVSTIDRAVDSQTGTIKVRASFSNPTNALRAGMNLTLNVNSTSASQELVIPFKAVQDQLGVYNVFVVTDSSTAEHRQVELGLKIDDKVVVKSGLKAGEKIVTDGIINVQTGVKVTEAAPATQGANGAPAAKK
ncbi:efflux RND transporter periplasmic adaptor subunit [Sphingobacteriaceae bacterium WQ 2009]|uniref:Efflux RND transporter periplasmic adaptor subunit n=1 Tax=Rhinopithecimicrobium faecis TaxID=2820698 RepID=A0A8T4HAT5_9SPHI|nr:efflux RND transporter periplasmic adaptor subunit [Sphingobacteriaceae bacterium WQ 2009]